MFQPQGKLSSIPPFLIILSSFLRLVYRFFHIMFQGTFCLGIIGYVSFLANTFLIMSTGLFEISVLMIFYAVYFGVVSRDMIDLASDMLTSNLGVFSFTSYEALLISCFSTITDPGFPKSTSSLSSARSVEAMRTDLLAKTI